jgi:hypothetical protein
VKGVGFRMRVKAGKGKTRQDKTRRDKTRQDETRQDCFKIWARWVFAALPGKGEG